MLNYFKSFPLLGWAKLAMGIFIIVIGIIEGQAYVAIMGGVLFLYTFVNKGGCPGNVCTPNNRSRNRNRHRYK